MCPRKAVLYVTCKKYETPYVIGPVVIYRSAHMVASTHVSLVCCVHSASTHVSLVCCVHSASTHLKQTFFYQQHRVLQTTHNIQSKAEDFFGSLQFVYISYPFHNYCYSTIWNNNQDTKISGLLKMIVRVLTSFSRCNPM